MKKLLSLLIASVLLCTQIQFASAAKEEYDISGYFLRYDTLTKLGLVEDIENYTDRLSYAAFAEILGNIVGCKGDACEYFGIKNKDMYYYIDYDNAAKLLVSVLGRDIEGRIKDYYTAAEKADLNGGVINFNSEFMAYDAVFMLYNALKAEVLEQTVYGDTDKYEKTGRTLSGLYLGAYYFEGVLSANEYGSLVGGASTGNDCITVEDSDAGILNIRINRNNTDTYSLLGCMVEGFYIADSENSALKELACINYSAQNDALNLNFDNEPYYNESENKIEYVKNGRSKSVKLDFNMDLIYNGQCVTDTPGNVLKIINDLGGLSLGSVILTDSDGNGKYDIMSVYTYENLVVEGKSASEFKIYGKDNDFISLENEYSGGRVSIVDEEGIAVDYSVLKAGDVLSIHESMSNDSVIRIVVCKNSFFGQINYSSGSKGQKYGINVYGSEEETDGGELCEFEFAKTVEAEKIRIGEYYNFYIDYTGRVAKAILGSNRKMHYGLFVKMAKENSGLDGDKLKIMMMTDLDTAVQPRAEVVILSDNAKYNGLKITENNINEINAELFHTVVTYYTTSDGKIKSITGADSGEDDALISKNRADILASESVLPSMRTLMLAKNPWVHFTVTDAEIRSGIPYTNISIAKPNSDSTGLVPIGGNKVICVPDISLSEVSMSYADDFYKVLPVEKFEYFHNTGTSSYRISGYYEKDRALPLFAVYFSPISEKPENNGEMTAHDRILLVNDVKSTTNPVTETQCLKITGMYGGAEVEMYTKHEGILDYSGKDRFVDVSEGDLMFVVFDANGLVTYGLRFYDYDSEIKDGVFEDYMDGTYGIYSDCTATYDLLSKYFVTKGIVYNEGPGNSGITLADSFEAMENDGLNGGIHGFAKPIKHIYVYDTNKDEPEKRVSRGSMNSGITYFEDKTDISTAVIRHKSGNCMDVVIYK